MLKSPADFWKTSWLNPDREDVDTDTPARIIGRLYHTAVFEPHLLNERFVSEVNIEDYEGMLKNATEIEAALDKRGEPKKLAGEKVLDKAIRLRESGYSGAILHLLQDDWEKARGERQGIPSKVWEQLQIDMKHIDNQPDVKEHVIGGFAEVSVLWTDKKTGIKMKCRIDLSLSMY